MKAPMPQFDKSKIYGFVDKYFGYLALTVIVLFVGLGMYYIVYPQWQAVQGVELLRVKETKQKLDDADQYLEDLKRMRDQYAKVDYRDIQRLQYVLPREFDQEKTFLTLKEFGKQSGLTVISLEVTASTGATTTGATTTERRRTTETTDSEESQDIGTIREVSITLGLSGIDSYASFKNFLLLIENNAPLLDLGEIAWPIDGDNISLKLTSYYLSEL